MIAAMSSPLNRKCLPMNVHGIKQAAALVLSHDSLTFRIPAASAAVYSSSAITHHTPAHLEKVRHQPAHYLYLA
jgi:hypothetical protein